MRLSNKDLAQLAALAQGAARKAGALIRASTAVSVENKPGGTSAASRVVTQVDRQSQEVITETLRASCEQYALGLLSEELEDDGSRHRLDYFWSIDPLDGTLAFIEDRPGFAVSIALVSEAAVPMIGVVYDPASDILWCAIRGQGITRNGLGWSPKPAGPQAGLCVFADRSFAEGPGYESLVETLDRVSKKRGASAATITLSQGAVLNACSALEQPLGCYFKFPKTESGGGALWDFAATACLFKEAGAIVTDISGAPLDLNRRDSTWMNHRGVLFATDAALAAQIRAIYAALQASP